MSDSGTVPPRAPAAPKHGRWLRRIAIVLVFVVLGFVLLALGLFPQEPLRRFTEKRMREAFGPESRMGYLHVVPGTLSVVVEDLELDAPGYKMVVQRARVQANPDMLLHRSLSFALFQADSPRITVRPSPTKSTEKTQLPTIRVDRIDVKNGEIVYEDQPQKVVLDGVEAHGSIGTGALDVTTSGGSVTAPPRQLSLGPMRARVRVSSDMKLRIDSADAQVANSHVAVHGDVGKLDDPDLDLHLEGRVNPADFVPQDAAAFDGPVGVVASVSGKTDALRAKANIDGPVVGGRMNGSVTLDGKKFDAGLDVRGANLARVGRAFSPGSQPVRGSASAHVRAGGDLDGEVRFETELSADAVAGGLRNRVNTSVQGTAMPASRTVDARWRAQVRSAAVDGTSNVRSLEFGAQGTARGAVPPTIDARLQGVVALRTPSGPDNVRWTGEVKATGGRVRGRVDGEGRTGQFHSAVAMSGAVVESLKLDAQGELASLVPGSQGTLEAQVTASGPLKSLSGDARVQGQGIAWNKVPVGAVSLQAHSVRGRGTASFEVPDWRIRGDADLAPGRVRGTVRFQDTPLAPLSPLAPQPIDGRLAGEVAFDTPFAEPRRSTVSANVTALDVTSGNLQAHAARPFSVALEREHLTIENLAIDGPGVHLEVSGGAAVAQRTVDLTASAHLDLSRAPVPPQWTAAGTLDANVHVQGTPTRPILQGGAKLQGLVLSAAGAETPLLTGGAEVRLDHDRLVLTPSELAFGGGTLHVGGALPIDAFLHPGTPGGPAVADVRVDWSGISVATLMANLGSGGSDTQVEGTLAGHLALQGPLRTPAAAHGDLALDVSGLRVGQLAASVSPVRGTLRAGILEIAPVEIGSGDARLSTTARVDLQRRVLVASSRGRIELATLAPLVPSAALGGAADVDLSVSGPFTAPAGTGRITLDGVSVRVQEINAALTDGRGTIELQGTRLVIPGITARLGGGTLALSGTASAGAAGAVDLKVTGRDLAMLYPANFKSRVQGDLSLKGKPGALMLGGQVRIERGLYDTDIRLENFLKIPEPAGESQGVPALLATIGLNVDVATQEQILIRNNLAQLAITGQLQVRGDLATPAPFGRLNVAEGGKVFIQTREFDVNSGTIAFAGTLEPDIAIQAQTVITQPGETDVNVTIKASGPLLNPKLDLTSQPEYSQKEIASLIATGRRSVTMNDTAWVAGEQAAALLAGRLSSQLSKGMKPLGFDEVTIQPHLLARETDPGARFTFGKHINPRLELIYSVGLNDAEGNYVEGEYRIQRTHDLTARLARDQAGVLTYGLGQHWEIGAPPNREVWKPKKVKVANVDVRGDGQILAGKVPVKAGDHVTPWDLMSDSEAIQRRLQKEGHIEAFVTSRLEGDTATFTVNAGPRYVWEVKGLDEAPDLRHEIESAIQEQEALDKASQKLLAVARDRGYLWARVDTSVDVDDRGRVLAFTVVPGPDVRQAVVHFPGASHVSEKELLKAAGGPGELLTNGAQARKKIVDVYRQHHYLTASIDAPRVQQSPDRSSVTVEVPVDEGPQARIAALRFDGVTRDRDELWSVAALKTGVPVDPEQVTLAANRVRDDYLKLGYAQMRLRPELVPAGSNLDVVFHVTEGEPSTVGGVEVTGLYRTRESLVRRQVNLKPGDPLDPRKLIAIEKKLLDLGIFSRAVVTATDEEPATIQVQVEERGPFTIAYDIRFSSQERATTLLDAEAGNIGGIGLGIGGRYRIGRYLQEQRGSIHLPSVGNAGDLTAALFRQSDNFVLGPNGVQPGAPGPPFRETQQGFTLQQTIHAARRWNILGGYSYKHVDENETGLHQAIAGLQASIMRETRDNPLDSHEGAFLSLTLEGGTTWMASDFNYFKVFAQFYTARAVAGAFTWAQGYRLGLAQGLEAQVAQQVALTGRSTELFHAGGPTSLRGYARDSVGPQGPISTLSPGGQAMFIVNQELRWQHPKGIGAAVFYDGGNVYGQLRDFNLTLLHTIGAGVRYDSPIGLLRFDFGLPLNPRPGDRGYQWYFALGQAF
jgi:outer membrane protein insertion porin family